MTLPTGCLLQPSKGVHLYGYHRQKKPTMHAVSLGAGQLPARNTYTHKEDSSPTTSKPYDQQGMKHTDDSITDCLRASVMAQTAGAVTIKDDESKHAACPQQRRATSQAGSLKSCNSHELKLELMITINKLLLPGNRWRQLETATWHVQELGLVANRHRVLSCRRRSVPGPQGRGGKHDGYDADQH